MGYIHKEDVCHLVDIVFQGQDMGYDNDLAMSWLNDDDLKPKHNIGYLYIDREFIKKLKNEDIKKILTFMLDESKIDSVTVLID